MTSQLRLPAPPPTYNPQWANQYTRNLEQQIQIIENALQALLLNVAPPYTSAEKVLLSNRKGQVIYDTTLNKLCVNNGSAWETITSV